MSFFSSLFGMNNPELSGGGGGDPGSAASNTTETTSAAASSITQPPGLDPMTTFAATTFRYQVLIIFSKYSIPILARKKALYSTLKSVVIPNSSPSITSRVRKLASTSLPFLVEVSSRSSATSLVRDKTSRYPE